ncbi:hypothetical protein [Aliarcobacter cryaerophilus]|uniref:hypothetical protein n=1 Tax=Aliarcobacter cryaerophilus TaxID=28198 RepID=UPI0021B50AF3|nr:hypothetical protein [Aliarcobacter cryaerophilus]MCT7497035.1 hypothetical protein [Aliarcobacter cryaerophilus]
MKSTKWIKIFFGLSFLIWLFLVIIFILTDPYNIIFNKNSKVYFSDNINTSILAKKLEIEKYSIIFGTSRSHQIQYDNSETKILNFSGSLYGNSLNVLNFLNQLNEKQTSNIDNIYYLVDDHILNGYDKNDPYSKYKKQDYLENAYLSKIKFFLFLDINKVKNIFKGIKYNILKDSGYYINNTGSLIRNNKNEFVEKPKEFKKMATSQLYTNDGIDALIKINKFCEKNNITIRYFTPTHMMQYAKLFDTNIMQKVWSQLFDGGIKEFYALWYVSEVSDYIKDDKYVAFKDLAHLNEYYNHKLFIDNVVNRDTKYLIKDKFELNIYIENNKSYFK